MYLSKEQQHNTKSVQMRQKREIHTRAQHLLDRSGVCQSVFVVFFKAEREVKGKYGKGPREILSSLSLFGGRFCVVIFFFVFFTNARKKSDLFFSLSLSIRRKRYQISIHRKFSSADERASVVSE